MLDDAETGAALKKAESGRNATAGKVDNRIVDQITHHANHRNDGDNLVKPGANRGITE